MYYIKDSTRGKEEATLYIIAFASMLFLQLVVYVISYYVTRAIVLKNLQIEVSSPLAYYRNLFILYGLSIGVVLALNFGFYDPIIYLAICVVVVGAYRWIKE